MNRMLGGSHAHRLKNAGNRLHYSFRETNQSWLTSKSGRPDVSPPQERLVLLAPASCQYYVSAFTLIELLVTLGVLAILLTVAIPSFRTMILNARIASNADSLVNALNYARGTALGLATNIKVCPLGAAETTVCGTDWSEGWIVVTQPPSGTATLLKSQQNTSNAPTISATTSEVLFDRYGLSTTQTNFTICDVRGGTFARSIEVLATGYVQSGSTSGQAVWNNGTLSCP